MKTSTQERGDVVIHLDFSATTDVKNLLERAATLQGMTLAEYAQAALIDRSYEVITRHETRVLSDRDRDRFLDLLDNPPPPNDTLRAAAQTFTEAVKSGALIPLCV